MSDSPSVTLENRGHVLLMGLNRPQKRNAFDSEMLQGLKTAFGRLETDSTVRCGVLFAHGEHFTSGLDLAEVSPKLLDGSFRHEDGHDPWGVHGRARTKPMVVAVQGLCLALGIELCLAQDVRVAARDCRFAHIEIKRGLFPYCGSSFRLVEAAGWGNAMRWLLTGDEFDAAEAHRIGLVQQVVEPGHQLERALHIAETIAAQAPLGVMATLASARQARDERAVATELLPELRRLMATADAQEGLKSFLERRIGSFSGK